MKSILNQWIGPALVVIIALLASKSLLINNLYPSMHDDQQVARLYVLVEGIKQLQLYPRWVDLFGFNYGYPLFNFYPPLVYYVGAIFHLVGLSYITSVKMVFVTGFIVAAFGAYWAAKQYVGRAGGILTAALYTFSLYHSTNVYVRGAMAEFFSMSIFPFVLYALERLRRESDWTSASILGWSLGLLILCHPLIAFPSLFFIAIYGVFSLLTTSDRAVYMKRAVAGGLCGLGLGAFFWLPSMLERKYTMVDELLTRELASYQIHFVQPIQLWSSPWGYGGSGEGLTDGMTFMLGKIHIIAAIVSLVLFLLLLLIQKLKGSVYGGVRTREYGAVVFMLGFGIYMMLDYSRPVWDAISYLWYLQFPWRFMTFNSLLLSVVGGFSVYFAGRIGELFAPTASTILTWSVTIIGCAVVVLYSIAYFAPQSYRVLTDRDLTSFEDIAWRVSRTSHEFAPSGVQTRQSEYGTTIIDVTESTTNKSLFVAPPGMRVGVIEDKYANKTFNVSTAEPATLQLNRFYFPGWRAYASGRELEIRSDNPYRLMQVTVPQGSSTVAFHFTDTWPRTVGNALSFVAFIALCIATVVAL